MKTSTFYCEGHKSDVTVEHSDFTTGYGEIYGKRYCFECCGKRDKAQMLETGKATLYLVKDGDGYMVTNWPNTLKLWAHVSVGRHNIAGKRYDAHFTFAGQRWHGVTYGDNTQICHCKRLKA